MAIWDDEINKLAGWFCNMISGKMDCYGSNSSNVVVINACGCLKTGFPQFAIPEKQYIINDISEVFATAISTCDTCP